MTEDDALTVHCRQRVGQMLGTKWRLDALIGVGGMAAVYAATHRNGATGAIKLLHPAVAAAEEARTRFLREAYIANKVGHPGTVSVLDDDLDETGAPYLVMELLIGESVDARAARSGGRLPLGEVLAIAEQTLAVLEAAHAKDIVHRDIKPENLFLTKAGALKVLDFGIARLRESSLRRTQTGMLMGTPAFMAPEQAMARWSDVDGRTDLWAVGATMFTLLTGAFVHEGETANEMLVNAATQPARSLARALAGSPLELVRLVDRALEYDKRKRFESAAAMRSELASLRGAKAASASPNAAPAVNVDAVAAFTSAAPVTSLPALGHADRSASEVSATVHASGRARGARGGGVGLLDTSASPTETAALRELFSLLEKALVAKTQYGPVHPETVRRLDRALSFTLGALERAEDGLVWRVNPYAFLAGDDILWEPEAPLNRIPYQLFSDGIRILALSPGLTQAEFTELLRILTIDPATELAPEDDLVTMLWDASFEHVMHHAIDSFADGDQQARAKFERDRQGVIAFAQFDTTDAIADCWAARTQQTDPRLGAPARQRNLLRCIAVRHLEIDTEAAARAGRLQVAEERLGPEILRLDPAVRSVLDAQMAPDTATIGERFVNAAAHAYTDAALRGDASAVAVPLRTAVDGLAGTSPEAAVDFVCALCRAVELPGRAVDTERLRASLAGALVSKDTMRALLTGASANTDPARDIAAEGAPRFVAALGIILGYLDGSLVPVVLEALAAPHPPALTTLLMEYVQRAGRGHEAAMGAMLPTAGVDLGLALVRILVAMGTPSAREAISQAVHSPHPVVRIEALGHVEGVSSERLRLELRTLLEDRDASVRLAALEAMESYGIRVAGPFLVLRIRSQVFDGLPVEERRQGLKTLSVLAANRAEAVAIELLGETRLLSSEAHEITRELAAEVLGRVGAGEDATAALTEAAKKRFRGSERVRSAATRALQEISERASLQKPARGRGIR
jgi:hypothetical protein